MTRTLKFFLTSIFISLACVACGSDSDNDSDTSQACQQIGLPNKIINGVGCGDLQQSPVVRIAALLRSSGGDLVNPICTGTMITSNQVLTAQHCIIPANAFSGYTVVSLGILFNLTENFQYVPAQRIDRMPGYGEQHGRVFNDIAILTLSQSVSLPTLPVLTSQDPAIGGQGWVYGYGQTEIGTEPSDDAVSFVELNAGPMRIEDVTPNHVFVLFNGEGTNVCFGDSGGPLIYSFNGESVIVGVVSQGSTEDCGKGDVTTYTKISDTAVKNWFTQVSPAANVK